MLKVFLVEDEFVVREGIKKNIDWKGNGFDFCGEAADGELAFPMIERLKPDIVITDIKMPFMDGLELSKLIKRELPDTEIIILSGFAEFEFAKEAIKIGVAEYLTKPINGADLLKVVSSLVSRIESKRMERELHERYSKEMEENNLEGRRDLFRLMITGGCTTSELLEIADALDVNLIASLYNIALIKAKSEKHAQGEYSGSLVRIGERLGEICKTDKLLLIDRNPDGKVLIIKGDSEEDIKNTTDNVLTEIRKLFDEFPKIKYFVGVGEPVNRLSEIYHSYETAEQVFAHRFLVNTSMIMERPELEKDDIGLSNIDPRSVDKQRLYEFLKTGSFEETKFFLDEYLKNSRQSMESLMFRQYIAMDAYFCVVSFLEELQLDKNVIAAPDPVNTVRISSSGTMDYICGIVRKALEMRDSAASNRYGELIDSALRYINSHYADDELSLNALAAHVNVSPNHLSMIFSQQTGRSFIKYLTDLRLSKAKELLRCTSKRSSEIAADTGYKDPHYFSYIFKKTTGMTPTQYRGGKSAEEDADE